MRFSYIETLCDPSFYLPLAVAAEEAGYSTYVLPDSIAYPQHSDTKYPYTADGNRNFLEDKPILEPFSLVPAMGAVTTRLRFATFVLKLPIRQPVLTAKQASSVAVLTGNRFGLGVGLSPWPEDFQITGTQWKRRGRRMNEMIEIIRGLCTGDYFEYHGEFYDIPSVKICPAPSERLPILVGGHAEPALRRAARLGDGWMHAGGDAAELDACLERLRALRQEEGRADEPFEVHVISLDGFSLDGVRRLEDKGVTDVVIGFRNAYTPEPDTQSLDDKLGPLRQFADAVIHKL
ncbi:MAG: TIGR03619 family F420-dependent LLM class oxidoreductase [Myxococcota bacterium]